MRAVPNLKTVSCRPNACSTVKHANPDQKQGCSSFSFVHLFIHLFIHSFILSFLSREIRKGPASYHCTFDRCHQPISKIHISSFESNILKSPIIRIKKNLTFVNLSGSTNCWLFHTCHKMTRYDNLKKTCIKFNTHTHRYILTMPLSFYIFNTKVNLITVLSLWF